MKHYTRTKWYGIAYIPHLDGSVICRCMPAVIIGCVFNYLCVVDIIPLQTGNGTAASIRTTALSHPYTFQLVGLVFGSLSLYRINISYGRYWEGVTMVKNVRGRAQNTSRASPPLTPVLSHCVWGRLRVSRCIQSGLTHAARCYPSTAQRALSAILPKSPSVYTSSAFFRKCLLRPSCDSISRVPSKRSCVQKPAGP